MRDWTRRAFVAGTGAVAAATLSPARSALAAPAAGTGSPAPEATPGFSSALALARRLRDKAIGSEELTRYFIDRIERFDGTLNAIPVRDFERALAAARAADAALARGQPLGPLHGLPMTIKESYDIAGLPTTWGVPEQKDRIASRDATVVQRFKAAGAHFMGKTNVPLNLGDFQSYNAIYGTTGNPWDPERTPGGSSGGSAAALAAGLTGLESGSDIGGSIRNPAHYCGVYGHKPTWGIVPSQGQAPAEDIISTPDLAVVGPMARSAEDLAAALDLVAGADRMNAPGWKLELPPPRRRSLSKLRVALWPDSSVSPVAREVADRVAAVGDVLARRGATVSDTARPSFPPGAGHETYMKLLLAIVGGPESNLDYRTWMGLNNVRTHYRVAWQEFFAAWDVLVCPIMPTTAFPHDHGPQERRTILVNGEPQPYLNQIFWAGLATVAYLPSTVFPTGPSDAGLPIGLQAVGGEFEDYTTIEFARLMADELGGFVPPPGYGD